MNKKLIIIGTGETGLLAYEYFTKDSEFEVTAFSVHSNFKKSEDLLDLPIIELENLVDQFPPQRYTLFVALSSTHLNRDRADLFLGLKKKGYKFASYISSKAFVWDNVEIGENCFILENNVLQPFTKIGDNVTLWSGNHIGHRTKIFDHVFISSHCVISGFCEIGEYSFLGVNSTLADNVKVAMDNFISMGAVLSKSTEEDGLYKGNPAEKHKLSAKRFCKVK
ncbi:acetyltransferase [Opitutales bacterium]|nr:acetyltransferase [Opitutales bacterium]